MYFTQPTLSAQIDWANVLVFDMNGLIIDDEPIQLKAANIALKACGYSTEITEALWVEHCVGHKPAEWIRKFLPATVCNDDAVTHLINIKDAHYAELIGNTASTLVRDGFFELLNFATKNQKKCALASSTTQEGVNVILGPKNLNIISAFDFIVCGDQVKKAKPDPEIYLTVKSFFGHDLSYLVFEDAAPGVIAATKAGMHCFAVPNLFTLQQDFSPATACIQSLSPHTPILT